MGQCWERYGLAYGGGTVADEEAVALARLALGGVDAEQPHPADPRHPDRVAVVDPFDPPAQFAGERFLQRAATFTVSPITV